MPNSQSHLFSLANLLESAERRHSTTPPPPAPVTTRNDSGLIDLIAISKRAREEMAQASATRTPVPMTLPTGVTPPRAMSSHASGPDFLALDALRRRKNLLIGAAIGSVALVVVAITIAFSGSSAPAPVAAAARTPVVTVTTPIPPPPAPPVVAAPAPEPVAAAAPAAADPVAASTPGKHKKKHSSKSKGPKLTKVASGGI